MKASRGLFLTLEGVDGAGKSTHIQWLVKYLRDQGIMVLSTREPGGCYLAEALRALLLHTSMTLKTETLLMFAARSEHLSETIMPALDSGTWVVCDRFTDTTFAYQGGGKALGTARISMLESWVHPGFGPDRTWLFDIPFYIARERLAKTRAPDRFESEQAAFFERVRIAYHARANIDPKRFVVLDGAQSVETLQQILVNDLDSLVAAYREKR